MNATPSLWNFFVHADFVVKIVVLILSVASVLSWTFILQRFALFKRIKQESQQFESLFWSGIDLGQLHSQLNSKMDRLQGIANIFQTGFSEFTRLRDSLQNQPEAIMEGTQRAMQISLTREAEQLEKHLPFLATVGSTSPYVGLLGTVWGIMTAFQSLSLTDQATLTMVAPGISQALIATTIGLFSAIPAVIGYNRFTSDLHRLIQSYETFMEEFANILHRRIYSL